MDMSKSQKQRFCSQTDGMLTYKDICVICKRRSKSDCSGVNLPAAQAGPHGMRAFEIDKGMKPAD